MDDWARAFWQLAFIGLIVTLLTLFISLYIFFNYIIPLYKKKSPSEKEARLKTNIKMIGITYIIFAAIFYFIEDWGKGFIHFYLPIACIITLVFLQTIGFPRSKK
jgi:hypothetical protein